MLAGAIAASVLGTSLARRILEVMSDQQFRAWTNRPITTVASYYILHGSWLLPAESFRNWRIARFRCVAEARRCRGIAEMAGLAAGSTRSRMTPNGDSLI